MTPRVADIETEEDLSSEELRELWPLLSSVDRIEGLHLLPRNEAEDLFFSLSTADQAEVILDMPHTERRSWVRLLAPDDAADIVQRVDPSKRDEVLALLDDQTRHEVIALLAYSEDEAGGLMSPRYARVRPDMTLDEAISYLKKQIRERLETIYYIYVLDEQQHLLGVVSFRELFSGQPEQQVREIMHINVTKAHEQMDQEALSRLFAEQGYLAIPIVDSENRLKGIVTLDDIVDVVQEEATEDIQKSGGMEALDAPYLKIGFLHMIKKRAGWLSALFLGEMLTATAMGYFETSIARAVVLALFVPLIISSGGNSGSQASTLVIRAMALREIRLRDWWRVISREIRAGLILGSFLGSIGFVRIILWQVLFHVYGAHYLLVAMTVSLSLIGVVTFGTFAGSMLPFILKKLNFDPASASAPFVATLVDVTGLIIYFTMASLILRGTLLH